MAKRTRPPSSMGAAGNPVLVELTRQSLERMQTSITAQTTILTSAAKNQTDLLGVISTSLDQIANGGVGGGPGTGGGAGGSGGWGMGPNARPRMDQNQTQRPTGPSGYGYGAASMGAMGGLLGMGQAMAARMIDRQGLGQGGAVWHEQLPNGMFQPRDRFNNPVGGIISRAEYEQRASVSERAARIGGTGSLIGGIRGMINDIPLAGKVAGTALAVAESGYKLGQFVGNQRSANAQYQAIYGPGTSGWDERVHNAGFRFRNTMRNLGSVFGASEGGLSDADADKAFKGISAMGYGGNDRNNMLGFARGNFNATGMGVDQSLALIGINAREAGSSLQELHTRLKEVSDMARQTGQSAEVFRQSFVQNYGQAVNAGFAGSSSILAQAQVASTVGQGRLFAGLNTSSMYGSMGASQVLANRMGMSSVLDFSLAAQNNPMVAAQAQQKQLNQVFQAVVPADVRALIQQAIARHGGAQNVSANQNAALEVVRDVEQQSPGSMNSIAIVQAMRAAGIQGAENLDATAAAIYYVQWVAKGGQNFTGPVARSIAGRQQQTGDAAVHSVASTVSNPSMRIGASSQSGQLTFDPVIARMGASHVQMVQVQTKGGTQLVSLAVAAQQFRDQLADGTAIIGSGPDAGKSVQAVYGSEKNAHYAKTSGNSIRGGDGGDWWARQLPGKAALNAKQIAAYHAMGLTDEQIGQIGSSKGSMFGGDVLAKAMAMGNLGSGKVTVDLSADAKKYLQITTSGDNLVNEAAASGGVPQIPGVTGSPTGR